MWGFFRLVRAAAEERGVPEAWREALIERSDRTGLVVAITGKPFRFGKFALVFKPLYTEVWKTGGPTVGSFSRAMSPDVVVEADQTAGGTPIAMLVLDAKYR